MRVLISGQTHQKFVNLVLNKLIIFQNILILSVSGSFHYMTIKLSQLGMEVVTLA
jgi:hypothetical protein